MSFQNNADSLTWAREKDLSDPLSSFRKQFHFPDEENKQIYFAGHSLGLMPKKVQDYIQIELDSWKTYGVEGHFEGPHPWLPYHENITQSFANLVGAKNSEVVAMNTLTVNLHLAMVSFYKPRKTKNKIFIEQHSFPSDKYAVDSQARFHGYDPKQTVVEFKPSQGGMILTEADILEQIEANKDEIALIMIGNCNYLSGQNFDLKKITEFAHQYDIHVGVNLAHGAGNLELKLHDWGVDFAVWCSYKYLNSGPGGIAGCFIHDRHHNKKEIPRFEGWWGQNKQNRFKMGPEFDPIPTVEAWQLSNPPIFQLAALRASMELFDQATMKKLRSRGDDLTGYMAYLIQKKSAGKVEILNGDVSRGSMLCLRFKTGQTKIGDLFRAKGVIVDFREPDIIRGTPAPLYNSFEEVYRFSEQLADIISEAKK
ncbi:MAG: kynureninase [Pseudobdellovibrionaceae bacterium]